MFLETHSGDLSGEPGRKKEDNSEEWESREEGVTDVQEGGDGGSDWGMTVEMCKWMDLGQILETEASLDSSCLWNKSEGNHGWVLGVGSEQLGRRWQPLGRQDRLGWRRQYKVQRKPGAQPSCAAALSTFMCPLELARRTKRRRVWSQPLCLPTLSLPVLLLLPC